MTIDAARPGPAALDVVMALAAGCRAHGLAVPTSRLVALGEAVAVLATEPPDEGAVAEPFETGASAAGEAIGSGPRLDDLYWAGRATLTGGPGDVAGYDRAFRELLLGPPALPGPPRGEAAVDDPVMPAVGVTGPAGGVADDVIVHQRPAPTPAPSPAPAPGRDADSAGEADDRRTGVRVVRASAADVLGRADLATLSDRERAEVDALVGSLRVGRATRRSRRRRPRGGRRGDPDLRRTLRRAVRTGAEPLLPAVSGPSTVVRPLVFLLDVSGSMEPYARSLLHFARAGVRSGGRIEVFALGTRCTRLTVELRGHDPDEAVARAAASVADWAGGTRLGENLARFNDVWGVRGLARGATVVVLSDGWERGDPALLGEEMARLRRVAHRVVWVNPLKAGEGYEPLAGGMAAALAHCDEFVAGHSFEALTDLAALLGGASAPRRDATPHAAGR